jgi:hypothetical protein
MSSDNICARPPATRAACIHQIHIAGGASGSITMVVMFVVCLCCVFGLSLIVCKKVPEYNRKVQKLPYYKFSRRYLVPHIGLHRTRRWEHHSSQINRDRETEHPACS